MNIFNDIDSEVQESFDKFYQVAMELLDKFYPMRAVTITSEDPPYITPELKMDLCRKNKLMRCGRIEEADAMSEKIGSICSQCWRPPAA